MGDDLKYIADEVKDYLRRRFRGVLGEEIEDVAQEALTSLITGPAHFAKLPADQRLRLALSTARHRAIDKLRRRFAHHRPRLQAQADLEKFQDPAAGPLEKSERVEAIRALNAALVDELSPLERQIVYLRFTQDRTLEDIGARLGISPATVYRGLMAALNKLRRGMKGFEDLFA